MKHHVLAIALCVLFAACTSSKHDLAVVTCVLNSDCSSPLVCRAGRCRAECTSTRDCPTGQICASSDYDRVDGGTEAGTGAGSSCLLPDEWHCTLNSDCHSPLVCVGGACVNECSIPAGLDAGTDAALTGSIVGCPASETCITMVDPSSTAEIPANVSRCVPVAAPDMCLLNSECELGNVCGVDWSCHPGCDRNEDCPVCESNADVHQLCRSHVCEGEITCPI